MPANKSNAQLPPLKQTDDTPEPKYAEALQADAASAWGSGGAVKQAQCKTKLAVCIIDICTRQKISKDKIESLHRTRYKRG